MKTVRVVPTHAVTLVVMVAHLHVLVLQALRVIIDIKLVDASLANLQSRL